MFLGDANDITSEAITPAQSAAWYDLLGRWDQGAAQFQSAYQDLLSQGDWISHQDAQVQSDYNALLTEASNTQQRIQSIQAAVADVKQALAGAWTAVSGAWAAITGAVSKYVGTPSNSQDFVTAVQAQPISGWGVLGYVGLGQFQVLIPFAIVAAALAAITGFLTHYSEFNQRMTAYKQAQAGGASPATLSALAKSLGFGSSGGLTSSIGTLVWIAAGVAAVFLLPRLIGEYKGALK